MNAQTTLPVGKTLLGRVINSLGEPVDNKGPLTGAQRVAFEEYMVPDGAPEPAPRVRETGIKVVDLLSPLPLGGLVELVGGNGVGKLVVAEEIMYDVATRRNGYVVCLAMEEGSYELSPLTDTIKEASLQDRTVMVFEPQNDSREVFQRTVRTGLTIASHFRDLGHEVLLLGYLNQSLQNDLANLRELERIVRQRAITTLIFRDEEEPLHTVAQTPLAHLDARIIMSRELARQRLWPAIDRLTSTSRLFETGALSEQHKQVAQQVRQLLQRAQALQDARQLSAEEQQVVRRARRIQQFFTQPFFVAEPFTELPGEYLTISETVDSFAALLAGRYDNLPEQAFYFIGTLDQAIAKNKIMQNQG